MRRGLATLLLVAACGVAGPAPAAEITAQVRLEPDRIGVDEIALLTIELRSGGMSGISAQPHFDLENLEIAGGPSRSESMQWINGKTSRTLMLAWELRPKGVGRARVQSVSVQVAGQLIPLADQELVVQQDPTGANAARRPSAPFAGIPDPFEDFFGRPRRSAPSSKPKVFLRAVAEPARAWIGQQITYTVYLYTQGDVTSVNPRALPAFRGFWARELELPQRLRADMVDEQGERYGRVPLLQRALFALAPGRHTIEPIEVDLGLRVPEVTAFGPVFSTVEELLRRTNSVEIEVTPLPPAPAGFQGAVGKLTLDARLDRDQVLEGEAATLTLTLAGEGNLQGLRDPPLELPAGLEPFPPQKDASEQVTGSTVGGRRTWSYVLIPERAGEFRIAPVVVPYFDPAAGAYAAATSAPLILRATALARVAEPIAPEPAIADTPRASAPDWRRAAGWAAAAAGGGAVALLAVWALRRPPSARRGARRSAESRLRLAAHETRPRQAAAMIEETWRDYLATRFELSAATPSPQWPEELARRGVEPGAAEALKRLADDLHYLRYAPQLAAADDLRGEVLARSRSLLRALR